MVSYFVFSVFPLCYCLVVSTSAIDCLERLVSEMTCYVLSPTHLLITHHILVCRYTSYNIVERESCLLIFRTNTQIEQVVKGKQCLNILHIVPYVSVSDLYSAVNVIHDYIVAVNTVV